MANFLNDAEVLFEVLRKKIIVSPVLRADQVGGTIDLRLGTEFVLKRMDRLTHLDPVAFRLVNESNPDALLRFYETIKRVDPATPFVLHPGQFALGSTLEYVGLPDDIGGLLEGRSGWAREGLNVHSTAGLIHPGHRGVIVFELQNAGTLPLPLYPGTRVAQLLLYKLEGANRESYTRATGAKYHNDLATAYGRPWDDWEFRVLAEKRVQRAPL